MYNVIQKISISIQNLKHIYDRFFIVGNKLSLATNNEHEKSGLGMIIRDITWDVKASAVWKIQSALPPEWAEAMAIRNTQTLCIAISFDSFQLESDCQSVIQKINSQNSFVSTLGSIIEDIKDLSKSFNTIQFNYCPRNINNAVDRLAKFALSIHEQGLVTWFPRLY